MALGAGLVATPVATPVATLAEPATAHAFDGHFAASRAFGAAGLTTQADAMILADLARREDRRFTLFVPPASNGLVHWHIA